MMGKLDDVIDAYHGSLAQTLAPSPATLNTFCKFFVTIWVRLPTPSSLESSASPAASTESHAARMLSYRIRRHAAFLPHQVYTFAPVIALNELMDNNPDPLKAGISAGLLLTLLYTLAR